MKLYELLSTHTTHLLSHTTNTHQSTITHTHALSHDTHTHTHKCSLTRQTHTNQRFNQSIKYQAVTAQRSASGSSRQEGRHAFEIPPGMEVQEPRQPMRQPMQRPQEGHDDERQRLVYIQVHPPLEFLGAAGSYHVGLSSFYHNSASKLFSIDSCSGCYMQIELCFRFLMPM